MGANRTQENLPAQRTQWRMPIDQSHGVEEVEDVRGLAQVPAFPPKSGPIEVAPGPKLHVNQHREHDERQRVQENAFSIHVEGEDSNGWHGAEHGTDPGE